MTWNDLITELMSIPENRREEEAQFLNRENEETFTIDSKEEISVDSVLCDSNAGNGKTTFVISR